MSERRNPCLSCGATEGPAIFTSDDWCSDICRKKLSGELTARTK